MDSNKERPNDLRDPDGDADLYSSLNERIDRLHAWVNGLADGTARAERRALPDYWALASSFFQVRRGAFTTRPFFSALVETRM